MDFHPLTADRWSDFETLFGAKGAYGGCWCMWWRLTRREFASRQGEANRRAMKAIVESGRVPGILGYEDGRAVAWCSVAPREEFGAIERSRVLRRIDDQPVWSIVCFYVAGSQRRRGVVEQLIRAAVEYVRERGGTIVEAYPTVPRSSRVPPMSGFMGFPDVFARAGFKVCAEPSGVRRVMRRVLHGTRRQEGGGKDV